MKQAFMAEPASHPDKSFHHASAVVIGEAGILIFGPSGAGKSQLALALIAATRSAGLFGSLIGDDRISLARKGGRVIARGHPLILGKIEKRGVGILDIPFLSTAVVRFAVQLGKFEHNPLPRLPDELQTLLVEGVALPLIQLRQDAAETNLVARILTDPRLRSQLEPIDHNDFGSSRPKIMKRDRFS